MKKKLRYVVRTFAFLLVLLFSVLCIQGCFGLDSARVYENIHGFLQEEKGSLDGVYIGGSDVHAFFQPLIGWKQYGFAIRNYSIDSVPIIALKYLLVEARKSQPDALFIISINSMKKSTTTVPMEEIHRVVDYTPFSIDKVPLHPQAPILLHFHDYLYITNCKNTEFFPLNLIN